MKKKQSSKVSRVSLYNRLIKKGMKLNTLLEFNDKQLVALAKRLLKEQETNKSEFLKRELEIQKRYETEMAQINQEKANAIDTNEGAIDPRFPAAAKYKDAAGNEEEILEDELDEQIFDDPDNAAYLDSPSFTNPDAEGFQSQGPMDSYSGDGDDEGFAGTFNETIGFTEPKYSFTNPNEKGHQSNGPMGHSAGIHEDDIEEESNINALAGEKLSGQEVPHDADDMAPDGMDDDSNPDSPSHKNDGDIAETISKKELMEVASSKAQKRFWCFVKSCKESKYKDCGTGNKIITTAKDSTMKEINDFCDTDDSKLPEKVKSEAVNKQVVENWLLGLVKKYERPEMTKKELIKTITEMEVMDAEVETVTDPDVEDAALELPSWLDFDSLFSSGPPLTMPEPTTKPTTTPRITPKKPGRKSPYQPKHKPKPKAFRE
tara:strand:- start:5875 stop:7170 length:1296 start_codon:yes stop_codon:yes gene_type:complete